MLFVTGNYAGLDHDQGDVLYYSGSNSHSNTDPKTPQLSSATKAMRASCARGLPVRVLRTGTAEGKFAPRKGIRYDGLYTIQSEAIEQNPKGGAYVRFKLVRCADQKPIDASRPTKKERDIFDSLKDGVGS